MKYRCPKCGKEIEISEQELKNLHNSIVCPQCLSTLKIDGDYAYIPLEPSGENAASLTETQTCPSCGAKIPQGKPKFCPACGHSLATDALDARPTPPNPVQSGIAPKPAAAPHELPKMQQQGRDAFYDDAVRYIGTCNAITTLMLQRYFNITPERAARLMAQLEEAGVVGPDAGGRPRKILIPHSQSLPWFTKRTHKFDPLLLAAENSEAAPSRGCGCWSIAVGLLLVYLLLMLFGLK